VNAGKTRCLSTQIITDSFEVLRIGLGHGIVGGGVVEAVFTRESTLPI
jgi:hypothetical protein